MVLVYGPRIWSFSLYTTLTHDPSEGTPSITNPERLYPNHSSRLLLTHVRSLVRCTSVGGEDGDSETRLLHPLFERMLFFVGTPYHKSESYEHGLSTQAWIRINHTLRFICTGLVS